MQISTNKLTTVLKHFLFWLVIFMYHVVIANLNYFSGGYKEILEVFLFKTLLQIILAYTTLQVLMPYFTKKKWREFLLFSLALLFLMCIGYQVFRMYYLEVTYPKSYSSFLLENPNMTLSERVFNFKDLILWSVFFLQPTFLLLIHRFYLDQQKLLKINEQKTATELSMLKNQLNPHFLFNTLNNLYSLTIKKSEKAPKIIEKLSDILDYILYRSSDKFVDLQKEIGLIDNYLLLEKIRYGNRVEISFQEKISNDVKIAPLLLLTFIENAFKHGVSQELNKANVTISIIANNKLIHFYIKNTKANEKIKENTSDVNGIGIKNVEKQLELLYDDNYNLEIENTPSFFIVDLKLKAV